MNTLQEIKDLILDNKRFAVTYHYSPDGDACGSVTALVQGLRLLGKEAYIVSKDLPTDNLSFLAISKEITGEKTRPNYTTEVLISLDCGSKDRLSCDISDFRGKIVNIDHHITNAEYGDYNYVDYTASATSEIVYELLKLLEVDLTKDICTSIYTGILTDTGSFRHSNTTSKTHIIVSDLLSRGINHTLIHSTLYDNKSFTKIKLIGKVLEESELHVKGKVIVLAVTNETLKWLNVDCIDTGDLVALGLQVKGVEVSVLIKETELGVKISLRSKNDFDVRRIAERFGGGGHIKAAGITIKDISFEDSKIEILEELEKELV